MKTFTVTLVISVILTLTWSNISKSKPPSSFQKGLAFPIWWHDTLCSASADEAIETLAKTGADWIQIVPTWYQEHGTSNIMQRNSNKTIDDGCLIHAIAIAHKLGMRVMLKPHVDALDGTWRGKFNPSKPQEWFKSYEAMITYYAKLAQENNVEILSIGCEYETIAGFKYIDSWRAIIKSIRDIYDGALIYAANWWSEHPVEFWNDLDYIGIDAYYELTNKLNPTIEELIEAWQQSLPIIKALYDEWQKPIVFTEVGYRSIDGANVYPWKWGTDETIDLQEQADCYEAVFSVFWNQNWFSGMYWWNWEPNPNAGGSEDDGYTPQNKLAENVIKAWYSKPKEHNKQ